MAGRSLTTARTLDCPKRQRDKRRLPRGRAVHHTHTQRQPTSLTPTEKNLPLHNINNTKISTTREVYPAATAGRETLITVASFHSILFPIHLSDQRFRAHTGRFPVATPRRSFSQTHHIPVNSTPQRQHRSRQGYRVLCRTVRNTCGRRSLGLALEAMI